MTQIQRIRRLEMQVAILMGEQVPAENVDQEQIVDKIKQVCCDFFKVSLAAMNGRSKIEAIRWPRFAAQHFCAKFSKLSASAIGRAFDRDPQMINHAMQLIKNRCETEPAFELLIRRCECAVIHKIGNV